MAEYIDRDKACARRERNKDLCPICQDRFGCRVKNLPTADVIERSKIDKAIKKIEDLDPITERVGLQVKQEILNILKRNVGE